MTDTEILDWIETHASKLGLKPDVSLWPAVDTIELDKPHTEFTDIRQRVLKLAKREAPNPKPSDA